MRKFAFLFMLLLLSTNRVSSQCSAPCNYKFILSGHPATGWNGHTMIITQNGQTVTTIGQNFTSGTSQQILVPLCQNQSFEVFWNPLAASAVSVGLTILDPTNQVIFNLGASPNSPGNIVFASVGNCTTPTCNPPSKIYTKGLTGTEVLLDWLNPSTGSGPYEVLVQLASAPSPTASSTGTLTTVKPYLKTGLQVNTDYVAYVRRQCPSTWGGNSTWSSPTYFRTSCEDACIYRFTLTDAFGDSWNGNSMTVSQNGINVATFTLVQGLTTTVDLALCDENQFQLQWNPGGSFAGEVNIEIANPAGQMIYNKGMGTGSQNSTLYSSVAECNYLHLIPFLDTNNNGIKDEDENLFTYGSFTYNVNGGAPIQVNTSAGNYSVTDDNALNQYNFSYQVNDDYSGFFSGSTATYEGISVGPDSGVQTFFFPVLQLQPYNNVSVELIPQGPLTAASTRYIKVRLNNHSTLAASGSLTFTKDPAVTLNNVGSGAVMTSTGFNYNFNLQPSQVFDLNVPMVIPAIPIVQLGQEIHSSVSLTSPGDVILSDNTSNLTQVVVAAYDPNNKTEAHGNFIIHSLFDQDEYLHYTINFQNTGTAEARRAELNDMLDNRIDESSVWTIASSHPCTMIRNGSETSWIFDPIRLMPATYSESLSKGFVTFKAKLKEGFEVGDIIPNEVNIFFDSNPPIITNTWTTEFVEQLSTPSFGRGDFVIYPNPARSSATLMVKNGFEAKSVKIYDLVGKLISKQMVSGQQSTIDLGQMSAGLYLIEVETATGDRATIKLIRE